MGIFASAEEGVKPAHRQFELIEMSWPLLGRSLAELTSAQLSVGLGVWGGGR